jgi:hypothetical protein
VRVIERGRGREEGEGGEPTETDEALLFFFF